MEIRLQVGGMSCQHCVGRVKKAIGKCGSVKEAEVSLETGEARFRGDMEERETKAIISDIKALGFSVSKIL